MPCRSGLGARVGSRICKVLGEEAYNTSGKVSDRKTFGALSVFLRPYWRQVCVLLFCTLLLAFLGPLLPFITRITVDEYLAKREMQRVTQMVWVLLGVLVAQGTVQFFHVYMAEKVGQSVIKDIRIKLYRHIQELPVRFFDRTPVGQLITRCVSDVEALCTVFNTGVASIFADALQILCITALMFYIQWKMAFLVFSLLLPLVAASYIFKEKTKVAFRKVRDAVSRLNTFVQEHIVGMQVVQIFTAEEKEKQKFHHINQGHRSANLQAVYYYSVYFPVIGFIQSGTVGLLVWYGGYGMADGSVMPGTIIAFVMYIQMLYRPFHMIADKFNTLQIGLVSAHRIFSLLRLRPTQKAPPEKTKKAVVAGAIRFHDVTFSYKAGEKVLDAIDLTIPEKKTMAIVGKTGAGKSSLVQMLNRFYEPDSGFITIGGIKLSEYDPQALRRHIGTVMQDTFLFSASIRDNVLLRQHQDTDKAQEERLDELAKQIGIESWVRQLPGRWRFNVLEQGALLSAGQKQLLSIFRTLAHDPQVVIMDEATASVDTATEKALQRALRVLIKDRTTIIVAHRFSTIMHADKIVVMDKGKIKEAGNHKALLAKKGYYKVLYDTQLQHETWG